MLKAQRHPRCSIGIVLNWRLFSPCSLIVLVILSLARPILSQGLLNISIPVTSSQIVYTPFVCNATTVFNDPQSCAGAWQVSSSSDAGAATISTIGPSATSANIIPQLFFQFRAFKLFFTTLPSSNATVNVTISANDRVVSALFNSSLGAVSIINLPESETSFLTITFLSSSTPTRFDLQSLAITVPANASISSFFPQETLPPSISVPTFTLSTITSTSLLTSSTTIPKAHANKKMIAQAVGLTVGLSLGLTAVAVFMLYYWKRRRRRQMNVSMEETRSGWNQERSTFA